MYGIATFLRPFFVGLFFILAPVEGLSDSTSDLIDLEAEREFRNRFSKELNAYSKDYVMGLTALSEALHATKLTPEIVATAFRRKAHLSFLNSEYAHAIGFATSAIQTNPNDVWSLWVRCWSYTELALYSAAQIDCETANKLVDDFLPSLAARSSEEVAFFADLFESVKYSYANLLRLRGRQNAAVQLLQSGFDHLEVIVESGEYTYEKPTYYFELLAFLYYELFEFQKSLNIIDTILAVEQKSDPSAENYPNLPEIFNLQGIMLRYLKEYERASESFNDAILRDEDFFPSHYQLCSLQIYHLGIEDSQIPCEKMIGIRPNDPGALSAYGYYLLTNRDFVAALDVLRRANQLSPNSLTTGAYLGIAIKLAEGEAAFQSYTKGFPTEKLEQLQYIEQELKENW